MLDVNVNISVKETYEVICDLAPKVKRGLANTFAVLKGVITEQQAKIFGRVTRRVQELLDTAGVQPDEIRPCPLMLGALWTERASLEENPTLQELWARLMANALNPNFREEIRIAFVSIILELSPLDALILRVLHDMERDKKEMRRERFAVPYHAFFPPDEFSYNNRYGEPFREALNGAEWDKVKVALDNLIRLRLIDNVQPVEVAKIDAFGRLQITDLNIDGDIPRGGGNTEIRVDPEEALQITPPFLTALGEAFILACIMPSYSDKAV